MTSKFITDITEDVFINRPSKTISIDVARISHTADREVIFL